MIQFRRLRPILVSFLVLIAAVGVAFASRHWREPVLSPAIRGQVIASRLGCFACHGYEGRGGVADPGARGGMIPGWDGPTVSGYAKDEQEIREWILNGVPARLKASAPSKPFILMPSYRGKLNDQEFSDLVAFFNAVSGGFHEIPEAAYEGRNVAIRLGCFGCHGPSGVGGCLNPGSFKGYIPGWDGKEFEDLARNDAELREWILDGRPKRLWDNRTAKYFLERQMIQMPAYRPHLKDNEVTKLVAYIRYLRKKP